MTTNRTSQAAKQLSEIEVVSSIARKEAHAIARKYESYEQLAIEVIAILEGNHDEGDLEVVLYNARRSLAFDPLIS